MFLWSAMLSHLQNLWPFSMLKTDDLKLSNQLVQKLSVPENTKKFTFAARESDSHAIVYILAAQNLSKQSALDAQQLIKEVQPKAVVCLVASSELAEVQEEEKSMPDDKANVPTSSFGVLKKCLVEKIDKERYEKFARFQVLGEIFGIGLYGHVFAAKKAAEAMGSQFILLESPYERSSDEQLQGNIKTRVSRSGLNIKTIPGEVVKALLGKGFLSECGSKAQEDEGKPKSDYKAPRFAQPIYHVLSDLHEIFNFIPAIKEALTSAQKMLSSVNEGEAVNTQILSEVHNFRIAIEALRTALNDAARFPIEGNNGKLSKLGFAQISSEEMSNAMCAQALKSQARKFGTVVAIVDAGKLAGIRKHWTTPVPNEVANLTDQCFTHYFIADMEDDKEISTHPLMKNPSVAVGAGTTAALRATSLLKTVPIYALIKLSSFNIPASLKFGLELCTIPSVASSGSKASALNLSASGEMIRAMAYSLIALAERTSLVAVQTSFYEIMRKRHSRLIKFGPLATFCCSMATCTGFMMYREGIRCAADSVPSVPMIASIGRGLERLQQASEEVKKKSGTKVQDALHSLICNMKKIQVQ